MNNIFKLRQCKSSSIIYVNFYVNREKITFSTNIECAIAHYEPISGRVLPKDKYYKDKNLILSNIEARISDVFVKFKLRDRKPTKESFLKEYNRPSDYNDFFSYVENYIKRTRITIEESTIQVHRTAMKNLKEYKPDLTFDDITEDFLNCYLHYLKKTRGMQDNTAYKKMGVIKKYVRAAYREGYMTIDPFQNFRIKKIKIYYILLPNRRRSTKVIRLLQISRHQRTRLLHSSVLLMDGILIATYLRCSKNKNRRYIQWSPTLLSHEAMH